MKKVLTAIAALVVCLSMNAQTWSVSAGYNHEIAKATTKIIGPSSAENIDRTGSHGFFVGANCEFPSDKMVSFYPGIRFTAAYDSDDHLVNETMSLYDILVPLNAKFNFGPFFVYAGPQIDFGISGKVKTSAGGISVTEDYYDTTLGEHLNRVVLNANLGLGFQFSNLRIFADWSANLTKFATFEVIGVEKKLTNHHVNVGVAFVF